MGQQGQQPQSNVKTGWEDVPANETGGWEDAPPSIDSLTANPKKQGTYRMLPPAGTQDYGNSGLMIPYENIKNARDLGFAFDPHNGDDTRYAHDLFTELNSKGQAPPVHRLLSPTWTDANTSDEESMQKYGVVPTPAVGTKEWRHSIDPSVEDLKYGGKKVAKGTINSLPAITAGLADLAVGIPGAATGPGDLALVAGANAFGAGLGEGAKQTLNHYLFGEEMTPAERAKSLGVETVLGGAMGPGARLIAKPIGKLAEYFGETATASDKAGFRMLPSEAHATKAGVFETYPKGSIFTSGKMAAWRSLQNQETEEAARKLADNISATSLSSTGSREEAGEAIRKGIQDHMRDFSQNQQVIYRQIEKDAKAAGAYASRKDLVDFAQKELDRIKKVRVEVGGEGPTDEFKKELQTVVDNKRPYASYSGMKDYRTALLARLRNQTSLMSNNEKKILSSMAQLSDKAIEDGLKASRNPNLANVWRAANAVTKEEHEAFVKQLVKNLAAKKNPEDIALVLRGNSPSAIAPLGIQETREAMKIIPANLIPKVQKQIILDTIYEATGKGASSFDEGVFSKKILQIGDDRGEVLFGQHWPKVKEFSELLKRIKESGGLSGASLSNPEVVKQVGQVFLASVAGGFGGKEAGLPAVGSTLATLAGQAALWKGVAKAITDPAQSEMFFNGLRRLARVAPYGAGVGYNLTKKMTPKDFIDESKKSLVPVSDSPIGPQSSVAPPFNPAGTGQVAYNHTAVNPITGHLIGSHDGENWVDAHTGAKIVA